MKRTGSREGRSTPYDIVFHSFLKIPASGTRLISMRLISRHNAFFLLPFTVLLAACSNLSEVKVTDYFSPYRIDINQGNYVTQDMVAQLKPGQTREQVRFILGSPLIVDVFHGSDRWDYMYRFQPGHGEPLTRRLVVYFTPEGKLAKVGGDVAAAGAGAGSAPVPNTKVIDLGPAPEAK